MSYQIKILRSAQKQLAQIATADRATIVDAIWKLAANPRPTGCLKLSGRPAWRIRIGRYRVIYEIYDKQLTIAIISISHRKDIYR